MRPRSGELIDTGLDTTQKGGIRVLARVPALRRKFAVYVDDKRFECPHGTAGVRDGSAPCAAVAQAFVTRCFSRTTRRASCGGLIDLGPPPPRTENRTGLFSRVPLGAAEQTVR
jgi:hypothetical protein